VIVDVKSSPVDCFTQLLCRWSSGSIRRAILRCINRGSMNRIRQNSSFPRYSDSRLRRLDTVGLYTLVSYSVPVCKAKLS
jgi:hypothetical protein